MYIEHAPFVTVTVTVTVFVLASPCIDFVSVFVRFGLANSNKMSVLALLSYLGPYYLLCSNDRLPYGCTVTVSGPRDRICSGFPSTFADQQTPPVSSRYVPRRSKRSLMRRAPNPFIDGRWLDTGGTVVGKTYQ